MNLWHEVRAALRKVEVRVAHAKLSELIQELDLPLHSDPPPTMEDIATWPPPPRLPSGWDVDAKSALKAMQRPMMLLEKEAWKGVKERGPHHPMLRGEAGIALSSLREIVNTVEIALSRNSALRVSTPEGRTLTIDERRLHPEEIASVREALRLLAPMLATPATPTPEPSTKPTSGDGARRPRKRSAQITRAVALLNEGHTVVSIASTVGLSRSTLYADSTFSKALSVKRESGELPRGEKDADGNIEAWQEDGPSED